MRVGVLFVAVLGLCAAKEDLSHGWGEGIDWVKFDDAAGIASSTGKPIMLIIHKTWCGACKALKPKFAASTEIQELSSKFVMVNVEDDEEPKGEMYTPDGGYIPRILYLNSGGVVDPELKNANGNPKYGYYYSDETSVAEGMKAAAEKLGASGDL
eukprot:m.58373 g.58373  ORF g.58373 m.58373 type:complete len:155 (+) comp9407_c0_seq1:1303-1767(+)